MSVFLVSNTPLKSFILVIISFKRSLSVRISRSDKILVNSACKASIVPIRLFLLSSLLSVSYVACKIDIIPSYISIKLSISSIVVTSFKDISTMGIKGLPGAVPVPGSPVPGSATTEYVVVSCISPLFIKSIHLSINRLM